MKMLYPAVTLFLIATTLSGCQTAAPIKAESETNQDVQEALTAVAGAMRGRKLSEEEKRNLERQIRSDTEAQSAIQAISESVSGKSVKVKYCPITGKRYAPNLEECPEHHVPLETVDP
jgi:hypothetical protein